MRVEFTVPGPAKAKARPRVGKGGRIYTPSDSHKYEKKVRECYEGNYYFDDEYISIKIIFWFSIPKSYSKVKHQAAAEGFIRPTKGDTDNYIKSILDGLNGTSWKDDRFVYKIEAEKRFTEGEARTDIIIESWDLNFSLGNVIKYTLRAPYKNNELEDLEKAKWYLEREIKRLKGE